ncbi:MAG: hypothetical protein ABWZ63_03755, partial [Thermoleophilaceae bacterium]
TGRARSPLERVPPGGFGNRVAPGCIPLALARLIEGSLPLDEWVAMVRAKQPAPASFRRPRTWRGRVREWFARR